MHLEKQSGFTAPARKRGKILKVLECAGESFGMSRGSGVPCKHPKDRLICHHSSSTLFWTSMGPEDVTPWLEGDVWHASEGPDFYDSLFFVVILFMSCDCGVFLRVVGLLGVRHSG